MLHDLRNIANDQAGLARYARLEGCVFEHIKSAAGPPTRSLRNPNVYGITFDFFSSFSSPDQKHGLLEQRFLVEVSTSSKTYVFSSQSSDTGLSACMHLRFPIHTLKRTTCPPIGATISSPLKSTRGNAVWRCKQTVQTGPARAFQMDGPR